MSCLTYARYFLEEYESRWRGWKWKIPAFFRGELSRCQNCGCWEKCFSYGESVDFHRANMAKHGSISGLKEVPWQQAHWMVCGACSIELDNAFEIHAGCPCVPIMRERFRKYFHGIIAHPTK
jgi:hypothetical protein